MVPFNISRCQTPVPPIYPLAASSVKSAPLSLDYEDSCASIMLIQPLTVGQQCDIVLPAGSSYSTSGPGPLSADLSTPIYGLRRFKIPLRQDFDVSDLGGQGIYSGVSYTRLDLWLPHGLSQSTPVPQLAKHIALCSTPQGDDAETCIPAAFNLTLVMPGLARMLVPNLLPRTIYKLSVQSSASVLDGFGLPLEASDTSFWANDNGMIFVGPGLSTSVALVELSDSSRVSWPFLTRASSNPYNQGTNSITSAAVWSLPITNDASAAQVIQVLSRSGSVFVPSILTSDPYATVQNDQSDVVQELALQLDPTASSVHVIHTCCNNNPYAWPPQSSASVSLVVFSSLSASFVSSPTGITAWVTNAALKGGLVKGALVRIFSTQYGTPPAIVSQCVTDSNGSCFVSLSSSQAPFQMSAVVTFQSQALVLPSAGYWSPPQDPSSYIGKLVVDRLLARRGETLFFTAFVQRQDASGTLSLPKDKTSVQITMSPGWDPRNPNGPSVVATGTLDPSSGTFHASIEVPISVKSGIFAASLNIGTDAIQPSSSSKMAGSAGRSYIFTPDMSTDFSSGSASIDAVQITVADPRPPTADLSLLVPDWALPNATVSITAIASSYLGTSVSKANITLKWSTANAQGLQTLVTDSLGSASAFIGLGSLPLINASLPGDTLSISLSW